MIRRLLSHARLAALALATILGLAMALSTTSARASDLTQCLKGALSSAESAADLKAAADFLENPANAACLAYIEDPTFEAVVVALVGMKAAKVFNSVGDCQGMAGHLVGDLIRAVAKALGVSIDAKTLNDDSALLTTELGQTVMTYMDCGCVIAVTGEEGLAKTLQNLASMAESCGAFLGDVAGDIVTVAGDILQGLEDIATAIVNAIEDVIDDIFGSGDDLPDTPPPPPEDNACKWPQARICYCPTQYVGKYPYQQPQDSDWRPDLQGSALPGAGICVNRVTHAQFDTWDCYPAFDPSQYSCGRGSQCASSPAFVNWYNSNPMEANTPINSLNPLSFLVCAPCSAVANGEASGDGVCGCANGYRPIYETGVSGKQTLMQCVCPAPMTEGTHFGAQKTCACPMLGQVPRLHGGQMVCACPDNMQLDGGLCRSCDSTEVYNAATLACVHCPLGEKPDPNHANKCVNICKPGEIFEGACKKCPANTYSRYLTGSLGSCEPCPPGSTSGAGSAACMAPPVQTPPPGGRPPGQFQALPPSIQLPLNRWNMIPNQQRPPMMPPPRKGRPNAAPRTPPMQRFLFRPRLNCGFGIPCPR